MKQFLKKNKELIVRTVVHTSLTLVLAMIVLWVGIVAFQYFSI